jgi:hypothetical protein
MLFMLAEILFVVSAKSFCSTFGLELFMTFGGRGNLDI